MIKSWVKHNGKGSEILVVENSTNEDTVKILDNNNINYIRNSGGTHSPSVDLALEQCGTDYALLVDTDIIHNEPFQPIYDLLTESETKLAGTMCGDRGGHRLHNRIHPWYMFIDVKSIKEHGIKFHDEKRIIATQSENFYGHNPLSPYNLNIIKYDVGSTFYEDINNNGLKIADVPIIEKWYTHYEGSSWHGTVDHKWLNNNHKQNMDVYYKQEVGKYSTIDIVM